MKLLLDTCSLLWALQAPEKLSKAARKALQNINNPVYVSALCFWEISLKASLGKLAIESASPEDFPGFVQAEGWEILPLSADVAASYGNLPRIDGHKDPFDRMLAHLALSQGYHLVSSDKLLEKYVALGLKICWKSA
ncbi:MAG: type II toxin-antitoxin system VapC family toxin [Puniceicoccaceae bacterium]|nr:MAG: type II toxin-antitoxin system VapC family toxin [Puniceicoccaceae bacterium]